MRNVVQHCMNKHRGKLSFLPEKIEALVAD